jgi:hypothetical protein
MSSITRSMVIVSFQFRVSPARSGLMSASPKGRLSGSCQGSRLQRHGAGVARQAVEGRAMVAGKAFQLVQRIGGVEGLGVQLQRRRRREAAGAADRLLLQRGGVRRAVGAQEEALAARGGGLATSAWRCTFLLEHRQAVVVRAQAASEQRIAVEQQVVRGDGGRGGALIGRGHVVGRVLRGDVLEHHLQFRKVAPQRLHHALDEHRLAVEDVDLGVGHLAMHQQQQALVLHRLQRAVGLADVGDAGVAVGRGAGRVQLERHHAGGLGAQDLGARGLVGQVQRHQRRERQLGRQRVEDALVVFQRLRHGRGHRRLQVGHHDGTAELARGEGQHRLAARHRRAGAGASRRGA